MSRYKKVIHAAMSCPELLPHAKDRLPAVVEAEGTAAKAVGTRPPDPIFSGNMIQEMKVVNWVGGWVGVAGGVGWGGQHRVGRRAAHSSARFHSIAALSP